VYSFEEYTIIQMDQFIAPEGFETKEWANKSDDGKS